MPNKSKPSGGDKAHQKRPRPHSVENPPQNQSKKADFKNSNPDLTQSVKSAGNGKNPAPEPGTEFPDTPGATSGAVRDSSRPKAKK